MPPRIPEFPCLQALRTALPDLNGRSIAIPLRKFSTTPSRLGGVPARNRRYRDPYVLAQARARKAANISKQESLRVQRARALGDPVRGVETEFVKSFDTTKEPAADNQSDGGNDASHLNYSLHPHRVQSQLSASKQLVEPVPRSKQNTPRGDGTEDARIDAFNAKTLSRYKEAHETVKEAVRRITNLDNGNSKDRLKVNVQRCVNFFGRHQTDQILPAKAMAFTTGIEGDQGIVKLNVSDRKRPDTGSSEVQIAVLTARIRQLAKHLERVGSSDKVGKRDLRVLVHKRQKLLQYLKRKERGGPRWQRCVETLGLTEGTYLGEISL